ncbi:MAG TPA: OmpA family protein [Bacteroidales bacterium]|nr:OmpA family protein [Bacteroidales bacterium]
MKTFILIVTFLAAGCFTCQPVMSQVLTKTKKVNTEKVSKKVDESVNKAVKNIGKGLGGLLNKEDKSAVTDTTVVNAEQEKQPENVQAEGAGREVVPAIPAKQSLMWSKFDFVPGDKIIFEDNLLNEENGEFPSRWDLVEGNVENANLEGENVIMFRGGKPTIIPYLKNPGIDYLPDVFTIEFDLYLPSNNFTVYFNDRKNQGSSSGSSALSVWSDRMEFHPARSYLPGGVSIVNRWAHIAIAYTSGKMKAYIDETRLINIPHLPFNPTGITLHAYSASNTNIFFIKNLRIAEGGVKYYERFLQDGKIVSNGIRFDTGKSSLRPESMGVLNEILKMLTDHPEIKISIEGHTDSDGDNDLNQKLSEDRAFAVMNQIIAMGISEERLTYKGYGESKPVSPNDSPERKAENRRVEFVKIDSID